jgi:hypothetical protein
MAEDVTVVERPAAAEPRVSRSERARRASYRLRFGIVYVLLAAVFGAGVGAFVVLASRPAPADEEAWSTWRPTGSTSAMVFQIAERIPEAYKIDGKQLSVATAQPLTVPVPELGSVPIQSVFVQPDRSRGFEREDDPDRYDGPGVVSFNLICFASQECAVAAGKSPNDRYTLLRRQALELSLYTLKYVESAEAVMVWMPPTAKGQSDSGTVFLTRNELADELRRPLREVLPTRAPRAGTLSELEQGHILRLTAPYTYQVKAEAAPDGTPVLFLTPPTAAPPS